MRRPIGLTLVGLGAFLLALAPLLRFYVSDRLVVAPLNYYQTTNLESANASYFDTATFKKVTGARLAALSTVRGDVRAAEGRDDVAVWDSSTEIYDKDTKKQIQIQGYRIAFDRRTSKLVDCCGSNVGGDTSVKMSGYGLLFPLANVEKRDYSFFDTTTKQPVPMRFDGEEKVQGLAAYRFVQRIPQTKVADMDLKLPGDMIGLPAKKGNYEVARYYTAEITVWVDPRTGIPVKHRQNINSTVQTPDGRGRLTAAAADLVTVEADQKAAVRRSNDQASQINLLTSVLPKTSLVGGLVLLIVGGIAAMLGGDERSGRRRDGRYRPVTEPSGKAGVKS